MRQLNRRSIVLPLLLLVAAACTDQPAPTEPPVTEPPPPTAPTPLGVYSIEITGIGTDQMSSTIRSEPATGDISPTLTNAGSGITFETVGGFSLVEGVRGQGGHRYVSFTYRVRNGTGVALNNVTVLMVSRAGTIAGTALSTMRKFDGTPADPAIAPLIVPTGAVGMAGDNVTMLSPYPDVLQVLTEAEVAAIPMPGDVSNIFPVGYMVRHKTSTANRSLPVPTDPNQYDGLLTASFRVPLQATSANDVFSYFFQVLAVTDTETRLTESIEESQDSAAVRRLRDRAVSLGATTVTVLNGSSATDAAIADYPGQRQICSPRTAGTAGSPLTTIVSPAAYSRLMILTAGETV
ncbi:MAG TPA: hypothetical protein VEW03_15780, partial [Longimicrobiaceae bacterium]|nr:hypothetical protein [Longimicrobiaceae bacterium]